MEGSLNKDNCDISIIVPVFNTEKYLVRCVESLISQSMNDIDIVLVDDGSTDSSPDICDKYASNDTRIQVIHKENAGQGLARNDGLEIAKGKYICFLDSDDYYEHDTCEELVRIMDETEADICSFGYQIDDKNGHIVTSFKVKEREYSGKDVKDKFILHYFGDTPCEDDLRGVFSCMSVFKKEIIMGHDIRFPSERVVSSEDAAFCLEYGKHIKKAVTVGRTFYHYCQNENSFSKSYRADRFRLMKAHINMLMEYAKQYDNYELVADRIGMSAWINLMACFKQEYRYLSRKEAINNYRMIAKDNIIKKAIQRLPWKQLPMKQRILYLAIEKECYELVYVIVGIRAKVKL